MSPNQLQFYGALRNLKADWKASRKAQLDGLEALDEADYVITKSGDQGPKAWALRANEIQVEENKAGPNYFTEKLQLVYQYNYQGIEQKEIVKLYRRK